ncbi:MAG: ABC transporter ATP-binding protein [Acidimicrobiia bacterium]
MRVELDNLSKAWDGVVGADNITLDIADGDLVAFLGPSGCGKTTTLLMVAGIYKPTGGTISFDGRVVNEVAPKDRGIGMVFQSYALYPHMTVFGNISYPLRLKKVNKGEIRERVQQVADMMGIGDLLDRKIAQLSGGQQQRVSLGRALVKEPQLLLFDEPLSNLDARLRLSMRGEIKRLQEELGITSIYVTHDQVEAMTMADKIAVMSKGVLQAYDVPEDLYDRPKTLFVAGFVGNPPMNFFDVEIMGTDGDFRAKSGAIDLVLPADRAEKAAAAKGKVIMGIRPEDVDVVDDSAPAVEGLTLTGEITVVEPLGREDLLGVSINGVDMRVLVDKARGVRVGDSVDFVFNTSRVQFFDPETELSYLWA